MRNLSHLNALKALEASIRLGSFRSAADELGVTPAAVGQLVRNLENYLGRQLLVRTPNGFEVSEDASLASVKLQSGFEELRQAVTIMTRDKNPNQIFVTVTPSIAERWLAPKLSDFLGECPHIDLRIDSTPYNRFKSSEGFDYSLRYERPGQHDFEELELFHEVLLPVCTPQTGEKMGDVMRRDCLGKVSLIHVDRSTDDPSWFHWEEWCDEFGFELPKTKHQKLHFAYTTMALRSMYDGNGLHLAQLSLTVGDLLSGNLVAPFGKEFLVRPSYPYCLSKLQPGETSAIQRSFSKWIASEAKTTSNMMNKFLS